MRRVLTLPDGSALLVRPLERTDRDALERAIARLSPTTRHLRFAAPKPRLTSAELDHLVDVDHRRHEALVAYDPATGRGVGVARYVALRDEPGAAEIAITVTDAWQGRGVGTALTALLVDRAREEGYTRLRAVALGENRRVARLLRRHGFRASFAGGGLVDFELDLELYATPSAAAA
jgi:RimJ/RimL family protein N-acetyltransferase